MTIQVVCECGFNKQVPDEWRGKKVKCKCGRSFVVGETLADSPANKESKTATAAVAESKPAQPKTPKSTAPQAKPAAGKPRTVSQPAQPADDQLDLSELAAGEMPTEASPIMQAIDEFDEVGVASKGKLDMLDLLEELDMREEAADELDMSESPEPAAPIPPAPANVAPAAPTKATSQPKPASKPAAATPSAKSPAAKATVAKAPAAKPPAAAKPAAAAPQQPAAAKPKQKPAPAKPVNPAQVAVPAASSPQPTLAEPLMAEPVAEQSSAVPSAPQTQNFTAGPAHVTGAIHIDAPEAAPVPVVQGAPHISVSRLDAATPSATSLALRQKAKHKSDMIKLIVLGIASFLTLLIFGCIFGLGVLLHKFDDPKKKAKEEEEKIEQIETPEITPDIVEEQPAEPEAPAKTDDTKNGDQKVDENKTEGDTTPAPVP